MKFKEPGEDSGLDGKAFVKLKDKEFVTGVFRGDVKEYRQHWLGSSGAPCTGDGNCPHCKGGNKSAFRFRLNLITKEDGKYLAKVFEQGWLFYQQLSALNKDFPLEKNVVKVTRHGSSKNDTTYTVIPVPNGALTADLEKVIAAIPLNELDPFAKTAINETPEPGSFDEPPRATEDAPF